MFNDDDKDISNEIYRSMEKKLVSNQLENKYAFNKYARTIDYLNRAANIFDKAGMHQEANEITNVMHNFANKIQNKYAAEKLNEQLKNEIKTEIEKSGKLLQSLWSNQK